MSSSLQPLFFSPSLISIFLSLARLRGAGSGGRTLERRCGRPRAEAVAAATQIQPTKFGLPNQAHMGAHTTGPRPITTRARSPETAQNLSLSLSLRVVGPAHATPETARHSSPSNGYRCFQRSAAARGLLLPLPPQQPNRLLLQTNPRGTISLSSPPPPPLLLLRSVEQQPSCTYHFFLSFLFLFFSIS